jgi:hypothetical protein
VAIQRAARDATPRHVPLMLAHALFPAVAMGLGTPMPPGLAKWQKERARAIQDEALRIVDKAGQMRPAPDEAFDIPTFCAPR